MSELAMGKKEQCVVCIFVLNKKCKRKLIYAIIKTWSQILLCMLCAMFYTYIIHYMQCIMQYAMHINEFHIGKMCNHTCILVYPLFQKYFSYEKVVDSKYERKKESNKKSIRNIVLSINA